MLEYHESFSEDSFRSHKVILLIVPDTKIGSFLLRLLNREKRYHALLVTHEQQAFKIIQEVKPDLFILDYEFPDGNGFELYDRLHALEGVKNVPAILSHFSLRFPARQKKHADLKDYDEPSEVESFFHTIQEVLA